MKRIYINSESDLIEFLKEDANDPANTMLIFEKEILDDTDILYKYAIELLEHKTYTEHDEKYESDILKNATIRFESFVDNVLEIRFNQGEYTQEQLECFEKEFGKVLSQQYANLIKIDFTKIEIEEDMLKKFFRQAGTGNIEVNKESIFYQTLQEPTTLSEECKKKLGIEKEATNLDVYKIMEKFKRTSFGEQVLFAKDLLELNKFMNLEYAKGYKISINDLEDKQAFDELREVIGENETVFIKQGIEFEEEDKEKYEVIENMKHEKVSLSKNESLFHIKQTSNEEFNNKRYSDDTILKELSPEDVYSGILLKRCIPARTLKLVEEQIKDKPFPITISLETEEDRTLLEEYKNTILKGKPVSLVASTVKKMPPKILEGLKVSRIMVGIEENKDGEYDPETYKQIYGKLQEITKGVKGEKSDYDKFKLIYERLSGRLDYEYKVYDKSDEYDKEYAKRAGTEVIFNPSTNKDIPSVANLEGVINGKCVCSGFSEILKQALSLVEIESHFITGKVLSEEGSDGHAWNRVVLEDKIYNCDLTADYKNVNTTGIYEKKISRRAIKNNPSLSKKIMPTYYLKSDKKFEKTHTPFNLNLEEAAEDFDADIYYKKDFRKFLQSVFSKISTEICKTAQGIMNHDISDWTKKRNGKEGQEYDREI